MTSSVQTTSLNIFCDWLDTTYAANSPIVNTTQSFLHAHGSECVHSDEKSSVFHVGDTGGVVKIDTAKRHTRISASGQALAYFRVKDIYLDYLSELSSEPHNVSRLDAALDLPLDGADVVASLRKRFSVAGSGCRLGKKYLPVNYNLGVRADGRETGTFYAGHRSRARQTARVYDKAFEAFQKRGEMLPPTTRYEVTSRGEKGRAGPCLRDAAEPERLFWHIASPTLLKAPEGVSEWSSDWGGGWHYVRPEKLLPAEILVRAVDYSPSLAKLIELADEVGPNGRKYLVRQLEQRILNGSSVEL